MNGKAISVRQPWAFLLATGRKPVENRTWKTNYRGEIYIHASLRFEQEAREQLIRDGKIPPVHESLYTTGGIIGKAEIVDCVEEMDSYWFTGPYGFVLANAELMPFQPLKGKLGIFNFEIEE